MHIFRPKKKKQERKRNKKNVNRGYVKFTPKYIIVEGKGGVSDFFKKKAILIFCFLRAACKI